MERAIPFRAVIEGKSACDITPVTWLTMSCGIHSMTNHVFIVWWRDCIIVTVFIAIGSHRPSMIDGGEPQTQGCRCRMVLTALQRMPSTACCVPYKGIPASRWRVVEDRHRWVKGAMSSCLGAASTVQSLRNIWKTLTAGQRSLLYFI